IRYWARLFDRVGVLRFRAIHSAVWFASIVLITVSMFLLEAGHALIIAPAIALLIAGRIINGVGRGGGSIAWNLGHLHFAREHDAELYMGIHVALTGLRGIIMPFVGTAAYQFLGAGAFAIAVAFSAVSVVLYRRLARAGGRGPDRADRDRPGFSGETSSEALARSRPID
ncbi:MAG: hypothetical protein ACREE7_09140, partial [Dongiaceae bacterium]